MKQLLLRGLLILFVMVSITSCSKDEPTPDSEKLLTSQAWVKGSVSADTKDPELLDRLQGVYLVLNYTQITFYENGTYESAEGKGTWQLSADNKKLLFDQNSYRKKEWSIRELKSGSLKVNLLAHLIDTENNVTEVTIFLDLIPKK
ncbi:hypothetical protein H7F15_13245 [Pontibacter sp. Tf4]|uniref:hypothetical protein n=1 Tax=Pontibacter sp. Tf4 TaxID=2761620 RepID=UPI00162456D7|nr:hypothetical protein [Pontibacter sp. Tf4]MBB6612009.1 hypothetical protein [Pontibacter sp. Tf4]